MRGIGVSCALLGLLVCTGVVWPEVVSRGVTSKGKSEEDRFGGMEWTPAANDLLSGLRPVVGGAGAHSGLDDPAVLTDGKGNGSGRENMLILYDSEKAMDIGSSTSLTFTLPERCSIGIVRVFSSSGDCRAFHCYDLEVSMNLEGPFEVVAQEVRAGKIGDRNLGPETVSAVSEIRDNQTGLLARDARRLRFTFWAVGNPFDNQRVVSRQKGICGSSLFEIDAFAPSAKPGPGNEKIP